MLRAARKLLTDGARIAFCEPNGLNPLFYLQISLTPGMSWRGEPGILRMRPGWVLPALERAGYDMLQQTSYGFLPPALACRRWGRALELHLERWSAVACLRAYRVFSGRAR